VRADFEQYVSDSTDRGIAAVLDRVQALERVCPGLDDASRRATHDDQCGKCHGTFTDSARLPRAQLREAGDEVVSGPDRATRA
jgi:ribosomal protein S27AE